VDTQQAASVGSEPTLGESKRSFFEVRVGGQTLKVNREGTFARTTDDSGVRTGAWSRAPGRGRLTLLP